jgi:hypothetical protein
VFVYQAQKLQADHEDRGSQPNAVNPNPDFRSYTSMTNQPDNTDTATMPEKMRITATETQLDLPILAPEASSNKIHMFTGQTMPIASNPTEIAAFVNDQTSGTAHTKKELLNELDHYGSWYESVKPEWYTLSLMDDYEAVVNEYEGPEILLHPVEAYTSPNFYDPSTGASYSSNDHEPTSTFSSLFEPPDSISKYVLTDSEVADSETGITSGEDAGIHNGISGGPNILEKKQQLSTKQKSEEHLEVASSKKEGGSVSQENEGQVVNTSDNKKQQSVTKKNEQQARISLNNKEIEQRAVSTKNADSVVLPSEQKGQRPGTAASAKHAGESVETHKKATACVNLPTEDSGVQVKAEQRDSSSKTNNSAPGRLSKDLSAALLNVLDSSAQLLLHNLKPRTVVFENSQEAPSNTPNLESPIHLSSVNSPIGGSSHDISLKVSPTRISGTLRSDQEQHYHAHLDYYESGVKKRDPNHQKTSGAFASAAVGGTYKKLQPSGDASLENPAGSFSGSKPHVHLIDAANGNPRSEDIGTAPNDDPQAVVRHGTSTDSYYWPWWYLRTPCLSGNIWFALFGGMTILFFICQCRRCNCQPSVYSKAITPRRCGCP